MCNKNDYFFDFLNTEKENWYHSYCLNMWYGIMWLIFLSYSTVFLFLFFSIFPLTFKIQKSKESISFTFLGCRSFQSEKSSNLLWKTTFLNSLMRCCFYALIFLRFLKSQYSPFQMLTLNKLSNFSKKE